MDKKEKFGWSTIDEEGVPDLYHKEALLIDATYQRTMISETRVAAITQAWSWIACGSLIVSQRADGGLYVIDGQHRLVAAQRRSDITTLPCIVFVHESVEQEAMAFYRANCIRGNVTPYGKLRALLAASDPVAKDTVDLMEQCGYEPSQSDAAGGVRCVNAFVNAVKHHRGTMVRVWPLIARLHAGLAIRVKVFNALLYIARFGSDDITKDEWAARVLRHGLASIENQIDTLNRSKVSGGSRLAAWAALEIINKGVSRAKRIELEDRNDAED